MARAMKWAAVVLAAAATAAQADEVTFKNGDKLTGEIKSADGGTLVVDSKVAGEVKVKLSEVKTFSTEKSVELRLKDGTVLHKPIIAGEEGTISTGGDGPVKVAAISFDSIKTINPPPIKWTGALTVGAIFNRGNTHTDSINAGFEAIRRAEIDRITLNANYNYSREKTEGESRVTSENWMASGKYDYFISEKWYFYGNGRVERDHIANLDIRFTPGVGTGYQWIETDKTNINTEAGLSWVYERYTDPEETRDFVAGRLAYHIDHKLNDDVKVFHNLEILPNLEDLGEYLLTTDVGLRARLSKSFFAEFKVQLQQNTQPAEDKEEFDTRYMASVGWEF